MAESDVHPIPNDAVISESEVSIKGSDWLAGVSFGEGLKRSIYLLRLQFRWFVLTFFVGGVVLSLIVLPVSSILAIIEQQILQELFAPVWNLDLILYLLSQSLMWGLLQNFILFFGVFVLSTIVVYIVIKGEPTLVVLLKENESLRFPFGSMIWAGLITAGILTIASVILIAVPVLQILLFFIPVLMVIDGAPLRVTFRRSIGMRRRHWQRILGALILSYVFILFAGELGATVYRNIDAGFSLYGFSLGFFGEILQILLTQIPIAMVAALLPLFSITFFSGAKNAIREEQYERYLRAIQRRQPIRKRFIPLNMQPQEEMNTKPTQ